MARTPFLPTSRPLAVGYITEIDLEWLRKGWRVPMTAIEIRHAGKFTVPLYLGSSTAGTAEREVALLGEIQRLTRRAQELHRRAQQAEAAAEQFMRQWDAHGGPRGGSFGRALASAAYYHMRERAEGAEAQLAAIRAKRKTR